MIDTTAAGSTTHDAPEGTLDGSGHGLARVGGLGGGKTDELGSGCQGERRVSPQPDRSVFERLTYRKRKRLLRTLHTRP